MHIKWYASTLSLHTAVTQSFLDYNEQLALSELNIVAFPSHNAPQASTYSHVLITDMNCTDTCKASQKVMDKCLHLLEKTINSEVGLLLEME